MLSKSSQYAIRSIAYLAALPADKFCRIEVIARAEGIPKHFLAKLMQRLVKRRLVRSSKGISGGFALNVPARKLTLFQIVDAIEDVSLSINDCILGTGECSSADSCALHDSWKRARALQEAFLKKNTAADLVPSILARKRIQ